MASYHVVTASACLLVIVCQLPLGLTLPVDNSRLNGLEEPDLVLPNDDIKPTQAEAPDTQNMTIITNDKENQNITTTTAGSNLTSTVTTVTPTNSTPTPLIVITIASTNASSIIASAEGQITEEVAEVMQQEDGTPNVEPKPNVDVIKAPKEIRFWWSDSTMLSVVIPVTVGLGSALFIITWVCCIRWVCCRRCRRGNYRLKVSPHQKTLRVMVKGHERQDFRQLQQKDRAKLLAETSDDEF